MSRMNHKQIKNILANQLSPLERLMAVGVFKQVPPTGRLLLTRGLAWLFSEVFYVAVTNWRLILLPDPNQNRFAPGAGCTKDVSFDQVDFIEDPFQNTILKIHLHHRGEGIKLRIKPGYNFLGSNKFDFIAAVKMGQSEFIAALP